MYKLREIKRSDMAIVNKWRNDPELITCLGAPFRYINEDVDNEWFNQYMHGRGSSVRCAIVDDDNEDEILGMVSLMNINSINQSAELHIMIGRKEHRGHGIGTFAVRRMIEHAFSNLNLRRVEIGVLESNKIAIRLYDKVGFLREGMKRKSHYKNGKFENMVIMGLLKEEFSHEDTNV